MSDTVNAVLDRLDRLGIAYRLAEHAPAHTMADCAGVDEALGALTVKNIFLTTRHTEQYYLCITRPDARFRAADISRQAGSSRLSFAPEAKLYELLRCHGGSASPLGLMFTDRVRLIVDRALRDVPTLAFHPCDNTRTVAMAGRDFFDVFLPSLGIAPIDVEVHDFI